MRGGGGNGEGLVARLHSSMKQNQWYLVCVGLPVDFDNSVYHQNYQNHQKSKGLQLVTPYAIVTSLCEDAKNWTAANDKFCLPYFFWYSAVEYGIWSTTWMLWWNTRNCCSVDSPPPSCATDHSFSWKYLICRCRPLGSYVQQWNGNNELLMSY